MKVRAFSQIFDGFTCWSDLESRQPYGALIQSDGGRLEFSLEAMDMAFDRGYFEILEEAA